MKLEEGIMSFVRHWCKDQQVLIDYHVTRINKILSDKKVLNFPAQMAILKKK